MIQINRNLLLPLFLVANFSVVALADSPIQFIHDIQGSGSSVTSPGAQTTVQAVVTGDYQDSNQLSGFFLQEEDADVDADPATSEGIFVFCDTCGTAVSEGDLVTVNGVQEEFRGVSQINVTGSGASVVVDSSGHLDWVTSATISLPAPAGTDQEGTFESYEGMLVRFSNELTVTEYFQLARFGQIVLSQGGKLRQFTDFASPSIIDYPAYQENIARRRIILDDLNNNQNVDPVFHPQPGGFSVTNLIRGGDTVTGLAGVLHWSQTQGLWLVRPQLGNPVSFTAGPPRTVEPEPVGGRLKVASFNLLNYFTTIDVTPPIGAGNCGPAGILICRGADSAAELVRQNAKLVAALSQIDADVIGVIEIENNAVTSLYELVTALNTVAGAGVYNYVDTGTIGSDEIKVGLIYRPANVAPLGSFAILDSSVDSGFDDVDNRPVLIQTFVESASGQRFTIAVNDLVSKAPSSCRDDQGLDDDPDLHDGQGACNLTRTSAAQALVDYLASDPTGSGDPDFLIIGDLNAYAMEDPVSTILNGGYTNLVAAFAGSDSYSYVFAGQWGYLDHVLATNSLAAQATGVSVWHINADEVNLLDYNDAIQDTGEWFFEAKPASTELYAPDPYRSSDHDPLVVGLNLGQPVDKGACEQKGWQSKVRADGSGFKNQGQCIRYVNTGK
ncbi:ExeM/NucH family extracellular endonuclease [Pseudomonadota bacterium]